MNTRQGRSGWRIESVRICNFRGVKDDATFDFRGAPAVLHGNNGVGKSTVAIAVQWALYGKFPPGVLQNKWLEGFLMPATSAAGSSRVEVTFARDGSRAVVERDSKSKSMILTVDGARLVGDAAEARRDALLGLDMDTFSRAVLVQQSRIRALLLDEVAERNKAIDRLLGMDTIESLLELLKSKDFVARAAEIRDSVNRKMSNLETQRQQLGDQLKLVEAEAREHGLRSSDFAPSSLAKLYEDLSSRMVTVAKKYDVAVDALPDVASLEAVSGATDTFRKNIAKIRMISPVGKNAVEAARRLQILRNASEEFDRYLARRNDSRVQLEEREKQLGTTEALQQEQERLQGSVGEKRTALRQSNALRQLLKDAREIVTNKKNAQCPVCEQNVDGYEALASSLGRRVDAMAGSESKRLEDEISAANARLLQIEASLADLKRAGMVCHEAQANFERCLASTVVPLLGAGLSEEKIKLRFAGEIEAATGKRESALQAQQHLEEDLKLLESREDELRNKLCGVLKKRRELERKEAEKVQFESSCAGEEAVARGLDTRGECIDRIRSALLRAKETLAAESLKKANPRAASLYRKLVHHPVFNTLEIRTTPRAKKVDYDFVVSHEGDPKTEREARLVLSDGQMTAAALSLFFALAESTAHDVGFLYIDDPAQSLDLPTKRAMAGVVAELATRRQVIVSSQDEDFISELKSTAMLHGATWHHIVAWNGNPTLQSKFAEADAGGSLQAGGAGQIH
jgi:DNA repair exonuclease SbcCD ATPase subunit